MPAISPLVTAISNEVVAALAAAGYPPLTDGKILLGRQHQIEQSAPPRIIFTPKGSTFGAKDVYGRSNVVGYPSAEVRSQWAQRSVLTDFVTFEVRCWGCHVPPDPDLDFDVTQALYQQVIMSTHLLAAGTYTATPGAWQDSTFQSSQLFRDGREFVFGLTFGTPLLDKLLPFAPGAVAAQPTTNMQLPTGPTDVGCTG
jgi:hypothetical protein